MAARIAVAAIDRCQRVVELVSRRDNTRDIALHEIKNALQALRTSASLGINGRYTEILGKDGVKEEKKPTAKVMSSAERKEKVLNLWAEGLPLAKIAEEVGLKEMSVQWIIGRARKAGDKRASLRFKRKSS